jgi:hypothetical protein
LIFGGKKSKVEAQVGKGIRNQQKSLHDVELQ